MARSLLLYTPATVSDGSISLTSGWLGIEVACASARSLDDHFAEFDISTPDRFSSHSLLPSAFWSIRAVQLAASCEK